MASISDPALAKRYKLSLVAFMSHRQDGQSNGKDHEFTQQELAAVTPMDLVQWMCLKVYGMEEPSPDDNPIEGHSNSLLYWKKAISFSCRIVSQPGTGLPIQAIQQSLPISMT
jgi:hypothetical protein